MAKSLKITGNCDEAVAHIEGQLQETASGSRSFTIDGPIAMEVKEKLGKRGYAVRERYDSERDVYELFVSPRVHEFKPLDLAGLVVRVDPDGNGGFDITTKNERCEGFSKLVWSCKTSVSRKAIGKLVCNRGLIDRLGKAIALMLMDVERQINDGAYLVIGKIEQAVEDAEAEGRQLDLDEMQKIHDEVTTELAMMEWGTE